MVKKYCNWKVTMVTTPLKDKLLSEGRKFQRCLLHAYTYVYNMCVHLYIKPTPLFGSWYITVFLSDRVRVTAHQNICHIYF